MDLGLLLHINTYEVKVYVLTTIIIQLNILVFYFFNYILIMEEIWKDVKGYEGLYKVSNIGNVMSLPRTWISANGSTRSHNGKLVSSKGRGRYPRVILCKDGIVKHISVHQLVAESFLGYDKKSGLIIDHINNISTDNRVDNLQIVTFRHNVIKDKSKKSTLPIGVDRLPSGRFRARYRFGNKYVNLGTFNCPTKAALAYQNATR